MTFVLRAFCASWRTGIVAIAAFAFLPLIQAQAQATRTWVSGVGDDVNPCSRTAPCKTFAGAISKTAAGGEISVLDPGGFGTVTITKSISIIQDDSGEAGILASGTNGIVVNAGAADIVILRGLIIDGAGVAAGLNGVRFLAGAALHIEKSLIKNFTSTAAGNGNGILFAPATGTSELYVSNTTFVNNGAAAAALGGAILVQPTGTGTAFVSLNRVQMENNRTGLQLNSTTTTSTTALTASVFQSTAVGNSGNGFAAITNAGGTAANILINNSVVGGSNNGIVASGNTATVRIGSSTITGNSNAVSLVGGQVLSYKNNFVDGNVNNNTPINPATLN